MSKKNNEKRTPGKAKKTFLTVLSVILLIVVAAGAVLGYRYRSHIKAAIIWLTTSEEDIQKNIDSAKQQQAQALSDVGFNASKELDEALMKGEISPEEHTQILLGNATLEEILESKVQQPEDVTGEDTSPEQTEKQDKPEINDTQTDVEKSDADVEDVPKVPGNDGDKADGGKNETSKQPEVTQKPKPEDVEKPADVPKQPTADSADADKRIAELVTKMYVLKSEYTGAIEGVVASMKADYVKLPPEQRTTSAKQSIAAGYLGQINSMEAQCDAQVNAIVSELRQILKENGRDMSLADAILSTYAAEKENTKAYYLSTYGD